MYKAASQPNKAPIDGNNLQRARNSSQPLISFSEWASEALSRNMQEHAASEGRHDLSGNPASCLSSTRFTNGTSDHPNSSNKLNYKEKMLQRSGLFHARRCGSDRKRKREQGQHLTKEELNPVRLSSITIEEIKQLKEKSRKMGKRPHSAHKPGLSEQLVAFRAVNRQAWPQPFGDCSEQPTHIETHDFPIFCAKA